jgi:phage repressor protein C with HTH and peptisase S24 domain
MAGEIGKVIKKLREQARLRQSDLSRACNVKQPNLSRIEKGHCEPRHSTLSRIAEALGTTVEAIEMEAAKLAAMTTWPLPRPGAGDDVAAGGLKTMTVPVFDTSAGYSIDFDEGGHPVGLSDMIVQVPLVDVPCFACRVYGDSMTAPGGDTFTPGDIVVFAQRPPRSGDFAFVRAGDLSAFKQVFFEAGEVRLVPLNRSHEENRVPSKQILQMWKLVQHLKLFE